MDKQDLVVNSVDPNILFQEASRTKTTSIDFWGAVPSNFSEAVDLAIENFDYGKLRSKDQNSTQVEKLKGILKEYHDQRGILTPKVEEHLNLLNKGSVLMGQQPVVFGGPGFIANKIGNLILLYELLEEREHSLCPVFFIGDYDGLQKELARQYFPNPISHNAFILDSEEFLPEESDIAAHAADLPPITWLDRYLEKLEDNLSGFRSLVEGDSKKLLDERWDHIKTILKTSFTNSHTLSDWGVSIWGFLTNIVANYGIVFLPTSHPEIRKLVSPEYLKFIHKRRLYSEVFQDAMDRLKDMGYSPSLPHRHDDYAPFTLECGDDANRITTKIVELDGLLFAEGKCPNCQEKVRYNVTTQDDISKIATLIGPRVDTSQAIFQELMNIRIRISGPGEIAYYAQAAPAVRSLGFNLPIFVKYKRAFYNATWIEKLGKQLGSRNQGSLQQGSLFSLLRDRMDAMKEGQEDEVRSAEQKMKTFIETQYQSLLGGNENVDKLKYLGWQFGRFTPEKFGQEVSWVWFDMALQTGVADYITTYRRMYTRYSTLGGYYFINCLL